MRIPGLGVLLAFVILLATGVLAANFFGLRLIRLWEAVLGRIPFVKSIYSSVKQVSDTLLSDTGNAFRKALLVQFPHENSWTIAFLTGAPAPAVARHFAEEHVVGLRADDAEPDVGLLPHRAALARARPRHVGRRGAEVRRLDGRRDAARKSVPAPSRPDIPAAAPTPSPAPGVTVGSARN